MPQITLDLSDATELAETLAFITGWLSGSQEQIRARSLATFVGHPAYGIETLRADLHRFVFLVGISDGEELFDEPTPRPPSATRRARLTGSPYNADYLRLRWRRPVKPIIR